MRPTCKGFDSLASLVQSSLTLDPLSGHLFVFRSRRGDRVKLLYWDKDDYAPWYKRLEKARSASGPRRRRAVPGAWRSKRPT